MKSKIIIGILVITNIAMVLFAFAQKVAADEQRELAVQASIEAVENANEAVRQSQIAEANAAEAVRQHQRAEEAVARCK